MRVRIFVVLVWIVTANVGCHLVVVGQDLPKGLGKFLTLLPV